MIKPKRPSPQIIPVSEAFARSKDPKAKLVRAKGYIRERVLAKPIMSRYLRSASAIEQVVESEFAAFIKEHGLEKYL